MFGSILLSTRNWPNNTSTEIKACLFQLLSWYLCELGISLRVEELRTVYCLYTVLWPCGWSPWFNWHLWRKALKIENGRYLSIKEVSIRPGCLLSSTTVHGIIGFVRSFNLCEHKPVWLDICSKIVHWTIKYRIISFILDTCIFDNLQCIH